ncbi:LysR family transcriptional regulator [Phyllobacterium sp. 22229]|uniref:LysR family transcriptional regulator n=1 Tax=Agrobacterium radiobacter TaxID=362 RepID=A0ABD5LPG5_AGRRD
MRSRRFLPSLSLLSAFEAVLRTGSTAAAARELNLTQSTISRLVQNLEAQLGRPLFERYRQRLVATDAATAYGKDVSRALNLIQRASLEFTANPGGGTLSLALLPAFGTRWLAPRLGGFLNEHPGITVNLATRLRRFNFAADSFDAAVHFGTDDWRDAGHMKLFDERLTACIAPSLLETHLVVLPVDILRWPLLQLETRPSAWQIWFEAQGVSVPVTTGMLFDQFATMTQAAISGLGVALLPDYLAAIEIREQRLVPILQASVQGTGSYWLVWPQDRAHYPPLEAFRIWLARHIQDLGVVDEPRGRRAGK